MIDIRFRPELRSWQQAWFNRDLRSWCVGAYDRGRAGGPSSYTTCATEAAARLAAAAYNLDAMTRLYQQFIFEQKLEAFKLGSADEHADDVRLTVDQRKWIGWFAEDWTTYEREHSVHEHELAEVLS